MGLVGAVALGFGVGLGHVAVTLGFGLADVLGVVLEAVALAAGRLVVRIRLLRGGVVVGFGAGLGVGKACRGGKYHRTHCCGKPLFGHHVVLLFLVDPMEPCSGHTPLPARRVMATLYLQVTFPHQIKAEDRC
ncbi:hypothetical protein D3C81_1405960 [compost metagenome]